ncbi:MAG: hypothetical protein M1824_003888 [Vezdaea acicularis]|nr:MAG: hypothetical protein M1824_003888 [Vezdaea acicularis]
MARSKVSKQPSHYWGMPFHIIRFLQFCPAFVVAIITIFFVFNLQKDHFSVPWTFVILLIASISTVVLIILTTILHFCRSLSPKLNSAFNLALFLLWGFGFGLLAWATHGTLWAGCTLDNWGNDTGVLVCKTYTAQWALALIAFIATLGALVLDIYTTRTSSARGAYNPMPDIKMDTYRGDNTAYRGRRDSGDEWDANMPRSSSFDGQQSGLVDRRDIGYGEGGRGRES